MQSGIVKLLNRETHDPRWGYLAELEWYENFYGDLLETCRKIAIEYDNKEAWNAVVRSSYNVDSPYGLGLAAEPKAFPFLLELAQDPDTDNAGRGTRLLAEALARCDHPGLLNCTAVLARKTAILALIRQRMTSDVEDGMGRLLSQSVSAELRMTSRY